MISTNTGMSSVLGHSGSHHYGFYDKGSNSELAEQLKKDGVHITLFQLFIRQG